MATETANEEMMFTSWDKAIAAVVMGVLYALREAFGIDFGLGEGTVNSISAALAGIVVWLVPNKAD